MSATTRDTQEKKHVGQQECREFLDRLNRAIAGRMTVRMTEDAESLADDEIAVVCWADRSHFAGIQLCFNQEGGVWLPNSENAGAVGNLQSLIDEAETRIEQLVILSEGLRTLEEEANAGDVDQSKAEPAAEELPDDSYQLPPLLIELQKDGKRSSLTTIDDPRSIFCDIWKTQFGPLGYTARPIENPTAEDYAAAGVDPPAPADRPAEPVALSPADLADQLTKATGRKMQVDFHPTSTLNKDEKGVSRGHVWTAQIELGEDAGFLSIDATDLQKPVRQDIIEKIEAKRAYLGEIAEQLRAGESQEAEPILWQDALAERIEKEIDGELGVEYHEGLPVRDANRQPIPGTEGHLWGIYFKRPSILSGLALDVSDAEQSPIPAMIGQLEVAAEQIQAMIGRLQEIDHPLAETPQTAVA